MILGLMNTQAPATCLHSARGPTTVLFRAPQADGNTRVMLVSTTGARVTVRWPVNYRNIEIVEADSVA